LTDYQEGNVIGVESQQFTSSLHVHAFGRNPDHLALFAGKPGWVPVEKHVNVLTNYQLWCGITTIDALTIDRGIAGVLLSEQPGLFA
jgi:hypothetical protein